MARKGTKARPQVELNLGGLFQGMGNLMDLLSKLSEAGATELTRSGEITGLSGKAKGVYGFTVKVGLGGLPAVEAFGNIKKTEAGPVVAEEREPIVDIIEEDGFLLVIAELPGVEEKDIHLEVKGDILNLSAAGKDRKYSKEVLLPASVEAGRVNFTLRNGVLEIRLVKKGLAPS